MEYDKIFDNATVKDLDFEVIFDEEDSIIEQVVGFGENGESLIGRDPEELTTDNDDSKVDIEGSSSDTTLKDGDGAEIKESYVTEASFTFLPKLKERKEAKKLYDACSEAEMLLSDSGENSNATIEKYCGLALRILSLVDQIGTIITLPFCITIIGIPVHLLARAIVFVEESVKEEVYKSYAKKCITKLRNIEEKAKKENNTKLANKCADEAEKLKKKIKDLDKKKVNESGEIIDLDNLFEGAECGLEPGKGGKAEEQTDETDKKDVLAEPDEIEDKDFHDESVDLDNLFSEAEIEDTDDDDILDGSEEGTKEDKLSEAEEQTDETDKKDVLAEPDEIEDKDFHDESVDLDNLFTEGEDLCPNCGSNPCKCGLEPGKGGKAEEQTDETDKKDILAEPDEIEGKDFHDESVDLDKLFEGCGEGCEEGCEGCSEEGEDIPATDAVEDDEDLEESYNIGGAKHINWFAEESIEAETDTEDELINAADNNDSAQNLNLDYQVGIDDEVIDDLIGSDI